MHTETTFIPYCQVDGIPTYKDSELADLYDRLDEGTRAIVFSDGKINSADDFVTYLRSGDCCFWNCWYRGNNVGFFWINRIETTHAYFHYTFFREHWGRKTTVPVGKAVLRFILDQVPLLLAMTPATNRLNRAYAKAIGCTEVGVIPNLMWDARSGESVPGALLRITREDIEHEDL